LIVVSELLAVHDILFREDQDMVLAIDHWGLGIAVGLTRVVQVPSLTTKEGGIDDVLVVNLEKVAIAYAFLFVAFLPLVGNLVADYLPHVLDQDVSFLELLLSEEPDSVNFTLPDLKSFGYLDSFTVLSRQRKGSGGGHVVGELLSLVLSVLLSLLQLTSKY
jgi:hypothetical protein